MPEFAFATLVTSDAYAKGAQVVAAALRELHPRPPTPPEVEFETVCIVTPETVNVDTIKALRKAFDVVIGVEVIDEHQTAGLALLGRPDLSSVLTKIHVFRLTQFSKVIFLDADVLPVRPLSHLFNLPHEFSAVPDVGWPDIFNSGMMVLTPGEDKFQQIRELVKVRGSWDGGDQGILNEWRGEDWHRLSFTYNTTPTAAYTYAPAYERFGSKISVIHFIGPNKPWKSALWRPPFAHSTPSPTTSHAAPEFEFQTPQFATSTTQPPVTQQSYAYDKLVDRWFDVYDRHVRPPETVASPEAYIPQRYEAAWDHPSAAAPHTFDLEELKRLAMEGSGQGTSFVAPPVSSGQGQYVSLPLDGRVDLMRPRPPTPEPRIDSPPVHQAEAYHAVEHQPYTEVQHHDSASSPLESQAWALNVPYITHTEASPPEHERRPRSPPLVSWNPAIEPPPTTFVHNPTQKSIGAYFPNVWDLPTTRHHHDDTEFEDLPYDDGGQDEPYPQVRNEDPPQHAPYHQDSYEDESHQWGVPQPESQEQTSRQSASYPPVPYQQTHNQQVSSQQPSYQQTPHQQAPYQQTPHQQTPYQQAPYQQTPYQRTPYQQAPYQQPSYQQPSYQQPPRQSISNQPTPTQLGPKQSAPHQPTSQLSSQQPQRPRQSYRSPAPRRRPPSPKPSDFFPVSAPPAIPQSIAHEYLAVTSAAPPTAKATTLFPWESAPRAPPRRVFPAGDAPPPVVAPKVEPIRTVEQAPPAQPSPTRSSPSAPLTSKFDPRTATFEETVLYANKMLSPPAGDGSAPAIARDAARALYSPGERKAGSLVYSNAWDNIPSIGHYVSRLVKPTGSSQPLHSPKKSIFAHVDGRRSPPKNQEQEREEADYGDDEDDAESNDDETGLDTPQAKPRRGKGGEGSPGGANRGQGSGPRSGRSRGASTSGRYSPLGSSQVIVGTGAGAVAAPAGHVYRSQGVQTTPKSRRSIGVQVSVLDSSPVPPPAPATVPAPAPAPAPARASVAAPTALGRRSYSVGAGAPPIQTTPPQVQSPSGTRAFSPNSPLSPRVEETASTALRSLASLAPFALPSTPPQAGDRGMLSSPIALNSPISPSTGLRKVPSAQGSPSTTTSTLSPITAPSIASSPIARPSTLRARTSSNATDPTARASWLSTSSSTTAVEPAITTATSPEGLILQPVQRIATRKWDPARGVDVFKRDSQEVLARFLKMAPWAESPHDSTPGSPTM